MDSQGLHSETDEGRFIVYLRFPFPRNGFQDPVSCEWSDDKEQQLREYISSRTIQRGDIDWEKLASRFDVSVPFILQQAIWLYERELEHVRGQMLKVNKTVYTKSSGESLVKNITRRSGESRERASSSFSPRRNRTKDATIVRETSSRLRHDVPSPSQTSSPKRDSLLLKSDESSSSGETSRRLLSMSRTFKPASRLREADVRTTETSGLEGEPDEDELDEDLYDAFLPLDLKPPEEESVSFSDLSDTSVSKSALEEALLSDYRHRGMH